MKRYKNINKLVPISLALSIITACGGIGSDNQIKHHGTKYKTVKSPYTGRIWLDRNVGAKRACKSRLDEECFGDYFQYGRNPDGHEKKNSKIRTSKIRYLSEADDRFVVSNEHGTWFSGGLYVLEENWAKLDGSSVCPKGFRVATEDEYVDELLIDGNSAEVTTEEDVFESFLKLPSAGIRSSYYSNIPSYEYDFIEYWTQGGGRFGNSEDGKAGMGTFAWCTNYTVGKPVRCIKATKEEIEYAKD